MPVENSKIKLKSVGLALFGIAIALLLIQYSGLISAELTYLFRDKNIDREVVLSDPGIEQENQREIIVADNKDFAIVIPKLGINIKVIPEVDPFNSKEYQTALSKGVAHAQSTSLPPERKNTVIFAHSTDNFYNANRYNAIFYLLNRMEPEDKVYIVHEEKIYQYIVKENVVVEPQRIDLMEQNKEDTLTLITCWPPGTTFQRRVVVAELD